METGKFVCSAMSLGMAWKLLQEVKHQVEAQTIKAPAIHPIGLPTTKPHSGFQMNAGAVAQAYHRYALDFRV